MDKNELDSLISQVTTEDEEKRRTSLGQSLSSVATTDPDAEARRRKLSAASGVPAPWVDGMKDEVTRLILQANPTVVGLPSTSPKTAEWLSNPDNAAVAHDDAESLARLERLFTDRLAGKAPAPKMQDVRGVFQGGPVEARDDFFKGTGAAIAGGVKAAIPGINKTLASAGLMFHEASGIDSFLRSIGADDLADAPAYAVEFWKQQAEASRAKVPEGSFASYAGMASESIATSTVAGLFGLGGQNVALGMFGLFADGGYSDLRKAGYSPLAAAAVDIPTRAMEGITEKLGLDKVYKPGSKLGKAAVEFILGDLAGEELNTVYGWAKDKATLRPDATFDDLLKEMIDTGIVTLLQGGMQGAVMRPVAAAANALDARQTAQQNRDFFAAIGEATAGSKTYQRLPDVLKEHVDSITQDGPVSEVAIPADAWTTYFQDKGIDPEVAASEVTGRPDALAEAQATGGDLVIPMGDYVSKVAGTEHHKGLIDDLRLGVGAMTVREAREASERRAEEIKKLVAEGETLKEEEPDRRVFDAIVERLSPFHPANAVREYATQQQAAFRALASRTGGKVDAWTMAQRYLPEIVGTEDAGTDIPTEPIQTDDTVPDLDERLVAGIERAIIDSERPAVPETERRSSRLAKARELYGKLSPEEQEKTALVSGLTNLPSKDAHRLLTEEEDRTPGTVRPVRAHIDLDSFKYFNDKYSYAAGDRVLAKLGDVINDLIDSDEVTADAFHIQGDEFKFHFDAEEDASSVLERLRETLRNVEIGFEDKNGVVHRVKGVDFSYGIGRDENAAERGLKSHKETRFAAGELGAERGGRPVSLVDLDEDGRPTGLGSDLHEVSEVPPVPGGETGSAVTPSAPRTTSSKYKSDPKTIQAVIQRGGGILIDEQSEGEFRRFGKKEHGGNTWRLFRRTRHSGKTMGWDEWQRDLHFSHPEIVPAEMTVDEFLALVDYNPELDQESATDRMIRAHVAEQKAKAEEVRKRFNPKPVPESAIKPGDAFKVRGERFKALGYDQDGKLVLERKDKSRAKVGLDATVEIDGGRKGIQRGAFKPKATEYDQSVRVLATLTGDELGDRTDEKKYRKAAIAWYKENLQRNPAHREGLGNGNIRFSNKGIDEVIKWSADLDKLAVIPAVKDVIENGDYIRKESPDKPRRDKIIAFHIIEGDIVLSGDRKRIRVEVGEDDNGNLFYDVFPDADEHEKKKRHGGHPEPKSGPTVAPGGGETSTLDQSIAPPDDGVNIRIVRSGEASDRRGFFRFGPGLTNPQIGLLENRNLSTYLHESGHLYLEVVRDLVARGEADETLTADWQSIREQFGVADDAESIPTEAHESFARSFEAYLMEGKSPSEELRPAFQRFKAWLFQIYKELKTLRAKLNPEVRAVFDRLLATDEEIARARSRQNLTALFATKEDAGMTEAEFSAYRSAAEKAHATEAEKLEREMVAEVTREREAWWKEERTKVREEVEAEAKANPVHQAFQLLANGETFEGEKPDAPVKLSRQALVEMYGDDFVKKLPRGFRFLYSKEGGMHPDLLAEMFGFSSGDEMVRRMIDEPKMKVWVERETDLRMKERHGDKMADGTLAEAALDAVHSDATGAILRAELRAIRRLQRMAGPAVREAERTAKAEGKKDAEATARWYQAEANAANAEERKARVEMEASIPSLDVFRQAARETIGGKPVKDIRPHAYLMAESKAGRLAFEAASKIGEKGRGNGQGKVGEITPDISKAIRRQAAPIRLRKGNDSYGIVHIEARHGEDIRRRGFASVEDFVRHVTSGFDAIYPGNGRSLTLVKNDGKVSFAAIRLEPSDSGDFYDVVTATPGRGDQFKSKTPLWERTGPSASSGLETAPPSPRGPSEVSVPSSDGSASEVNGRHWAGVAAKYKHQQLLNHFLYLEARKAVADAEKIAEHMKGLEKESAQKRLGKAGADYLEQVNAILERYEFRKVSGTRIGRRESLMEWIVRQEEAGMEPAIPESVLNDARQVNFKTLSVDELRAVYDAVRNIEHLARLKNRLLGNRAKVEFAEAVNDLVDTIEKTIGLGKPVPIDRETMTYLEKKADTLSSFDASLIKTEQLMDWFDGGNINGPWQSLIFRPIAEAQAAENDLHARHGKKIAELFEAYGKARGDRALAEKIHIESVGEPLTRQALIAVALNTGNESNLDKLLRGRDWNETQLSEMTGHLTAEDWRFVQSVWDAVEEFWPEIAALEKRMTGIEPEKIPSREFSVSPKDGGEALTLKGGYYPVVYDPRLSSAGERQADAQGERLFDGNHIRATTEKGHTKARNAKAARPILLSLDIIPKHIASVVHDLTHREAVVDALRLINAEDVRKAVVESMGAPYHRMLNLWLANVANDRNVDQTGTEFWNRFMSRIRSNATIVAMGFKATTMLSQVAGLSNSLDLVEGKHLTAAVAKFSRHPLESLAWVQEKSGEMRHRFETVDRDVRDGIRKLAGKDGALTAVQRQAFAGIGFFDSMVSVPTWIGAYEQAKAQGLGEADAIASADKAVRLSQGAGGAKDLSAVQRKNETMKLLTMFYSYFNVLYNRFRNAGHQVAVGAEGFGTLAYRSLVIWIVPVILSELLAGRGPDDDEDAAAWAARKVLLYPFGVVPILRDAVNAFDSGRDYQLTPVADAINKMVRAGIQAEKVASGEAEPESLVLPVVDAVGYGVGLPTGQAKITGRYIWDLLEGNESPDDPGEFIRNILFNRKKKAS